jgi:hypothetical protein
MGSEVSFRQNVTNISTPNLPITNTQKNQSHSAQCNYVSVVAGTLEPLYVHLNGLMSRAAGVLIPVGARYFVFIKTVKNGSVAHPASYSTMTEFISEGCSGQEMNLTFDLHVAPRLRIHFHVWDTANFAFYFSYPSHAWRDHLWPLRLDSSQRSDDRNTTKGHINRKQLPQSS